MNVMFVGEGFGSGEAFGGGFENSMISLLGSSYFGLVDSLGIS